MKFKQFRSLYFANSEYLRAFFKNAKIFLLLQFGFTLLTIPINYFTVYAPKEFLDEIVDGVNIINALIWIIVFLLVGIINNILNSCLQLYKDIISSKAKLSVKKTVFNKLDKLYLSFFDDPKNIDVFNRAMNYSENGGDIFVSMIVSFVLSIISLGTMIYVSIIFEWWLWIIILAQVAWQFLYDRYLKRKNYNFYKEKTTLDRKMNYFSSVPTRRECLSEIKTNNSMDFFFKKYDTSYSENTKHMFKFRLLTNVRSVIMQLPECLFTLICYFVIGNSILQGRASIGDYALFFAMVSNISSSLKSIVFDFNGFYEQALNAQSFIDFMNFETSEEDERLINNNEFEANELSSIDEIEFKNVSFKYPGNSDEALNNISLKIHKGEKITIVGYNGAGKSTFIKLLSRLYPLKDGEILINGKSISLYNKHSYWNKISVVFQDHQEFSMSIAENITLSEKTSDEITKSIWSVLDAVNISEKFEKTELQLDTQLTKNFDPNGIELSGGEKQKIAIARAFIKDCDLYVFDEPSSALDPLSENLLYQAMLNFSKEKTVIFISHRLSSVYISDRVIFFKDGRIIGDGTHDDLFSNCEEYRCMYCSQADKYEKLQVDT